MRKKLILFSILLLNFGLLIGQSKTNPIKINESSFEIASEKDTPFFINSNVEVIFNVLSVFDGIAKFDARYCFQFALKLPSGNLKKENENLILYKFHERTKDDYVYGEKLKIHTLENGKLKTEKFKLKSFYSDSNYLFLDLKTIKSINDAIIEGEFYIRRSNIKTIELSVNNQFHILNAYFKIGIPEKYDYEVINLMPAKLNYKESIEKGPYVGYKLIGRDLVKEFCNLKYYYFSTQYPIQVSDNPIFTPLIFKLVQENKVDY